MMKPRDCAVATALILQGYMRANDEDGTTELADAIRAVVQECLAWGENLTDEQWGRAFGPVELVCATLNAMKDDQANVV